MKRILYSSTLVLSILFLTGNPGFSQNPPEAFDDSAFVRQFHEIWIDVLENDVDPDGDSLEIFWIGQPMLGDIISSNDTTILFKASAEMGWDSFMYKIRKKNYQQLQDSAWVKVLISENNVPVIGNDSVPVMVGITATINIFDYAYDPDGHDFYIWQVRDPENGEASRLSDSTFTVKIPYNYQGPDSVEIRLRETGTYVQVIDYVLLNVTSNPWFPYALNDTMPALQGDTIFIRALDNDVDLQGDELRVFDVNATCYSSFNDSIITLLPSSLIPPGLRRFAYYQNCEVADSVHVSNKAEVWLDVQENPNLPVGVNDTVTALAGYPVEIPVLLNDYDINGDSLIIRGVYNYIDWGFCQFTDSIITFSPFCYLDKNFRFLYSAREKHNAAHYSQHTAVVVQIIENQNQPVAVDDEITLNAFDTITFNPLLNDYDPDGAPLKMNYLGWTTGIGGNYNDSLVTLISNMNYSGVVRVPYRFCQVNNPAMVSKTGYINVRILPDESMFYGVNDTVNTYPGFTGIKNVVANDYNPGSDSLILDYLGGSTIVNIIRLNDSSVYFNMGYTASGDEEKIYKISDVNNENTSFAKIVFQIQPIPGLIDSLDVNNLCASFSTFGMHFIDPYHENDASIAKFEVPKGSGKSTLSTNSVWVAGISDDTLYAAMESQRYSGEDFWAGPVSDVYQDDDMAKYHVWKLTRQEIDFHIAHYKDPDYVPVENIRSWPGNGNPELGQSLQLAPYFDQNNDGVYNPYEGDFPLVRGDQSLFFIFNDSRGNFHSASGGIKMNLEIHGNAYSFDQPQDSALFNTVFLHYDFYNRSSKTYDSTYVGIFNNFNIGYKEDDFIGCDVTRGSAFGYNGLGVDGEGEPESYGVNPPVQSMVIISGPAMPEDGLDNPAGGCDESVNGMNFGDGIADNERFGMTRFLHFEFNSNYPYPPGMAYHCYNMFEGRWKDNTPVNYGGTGHIMDLQTVGPACRFIYPGASDPLNWGTGCEFPNGGFNQNGLFWNEETLQHYPGDRGGLSVTGPFTFKPSEVQSLDVAFVYARDNNPEDEISALDIMNVRIDTLRQRVNRNEIIYLPEYSVGINETIVAPMQFRIYPNPASGNEIIIKTDLKSCSKQGSFQIIDVCGRKVKSGKLNIEKAFTIRIGELPGGIYLLTLEIEGHFSNQKIIIQK